MLGNSEIRRVATSRVVFGDPMCARLCRRTSSLDPGAGPATMRSPGRAARSEQRGQDFKSGSVCAWADHRSGHEYRQPGVSALSPELRPRRRQRVIPCKERSHGSLCGTGWVRTSPLARNRRDRATCRCGSRRHPAGRSRGCMSHTSRDGRWPRARSSSHTPRTRSCPESKDDGPDGWACDRFTGWATRRSSRSLCAGTSGFRSGPSDRPVSIWSERSVLITNYAQQVAATMNFSLLRGRS